MKDIQPPPRSVHLSEPKGSVTKEKKGSKQTGRIKAEDEGDGQLGWDSRTEKPKNKPHILYTKD